MRGITTIIIAAAVVLVVVLGLMMRREPDFDSEVANAPARERARPEKRSRPARVEERLQRLREGNEARRQGAPGLRMPERKAVVPVPLPTARPKGAAEEEDDVEEIAELTETIRNDPDPEERASAVFFLGGASEEAAVPVLVEALNDPNAEVRLAVVEALGDYVDEISPDVLIPALSDADPEVRFEALGTIGDMENTEIVREMARRMLNDNDEDVRSLAEGILEMDDEN